MRDRYQLKTLEDILDIPEDCMDAFLPELKTWHQQVHAWKELLLATAEAAGAPTDSIEVGSEGMTWIDDGKRDITINLQPVDTEAKR
jgi:hypothetical protein